MATSISYDFNGAVILITGGASGIGAATARACAAAGAQVIAADIDRDAFAAAGKHPGIEPYRLDVSDSVAVNGCIDDIDQRYGRIDAAVLAAAIQRRTPTEDVSDDEWHRHMAVNLNGVFYCLRAIAPIMRRQRRGALLTFTSGLATQGWPGAAAYAATKAGIVGLTKTVALELRPYGVRANVLSPGLVATPIFLDVASQEEIAMYEHALGVSDPDAVVPTVLHLIADGSMGLTGTIVERRLVPGR